MEWKKFDGEYEKQFYDVRLPDGTIIEGCWPNAGYMNGTNNKGQWGEGECEVRVSGKEFNL